MINAAIVGLGRWGRTLVEAVQGKSGTLAMVRSTPAYLRVHAFGRNVSAEYRRLRGDRRSGEIRRAGRRGLTVALQLMVTLTLTLAPLTGAREG